jgi:hypothetical protein
MVVPAAGTYTLVFDCLTLPFGTPDVTSMQGDLTFGIGTSANPNIILTNQSPRTMIGNNGLYSWFNESRYLYLNVMAGIGTALGFRGALDIPAGLGGASIASNGDYSQGWGLAHSSTRSTTTITTTTTIKHNVTDTKFTLNVTPKNSFTWYLSSISAASSPTANDGNIAIVCSSNTAIFDIVILRTPY